MLLVDARAQRLRGLALALCLHYVVSLRAVPLRAHGARRAVPLPAAAASVDAAPARLDRGQWAGWECRFLGSGTAAGIDPADVPPSFAEWDVQIYGYETLCAEDEGCGTRQLFRVLPSEGCAADLPVTEERSEAVGSRCEVTGAGAMSVQGVFDATPRRTEGADESIWRVRFRLSASWRDSPSGGGTLQRGGMTIAVERRIPEAPFDAEELAANLADARTVRRAVAADCFVQDDTAEGTDAMAILGGASGEAWVGDGRRVRATALEGASGAAGRFAVASGSAGDVLEGAGAESASLCVVVLDAATGSGAALLFPERAGCGAAGDRFDAVAVPLAREKC